MADEDEAPAPSDEDEAPAPSGGELISVPSDDEDEAPAPRTSTLTSFWKQPGEAAGEPSTPFKRRSVGGPLTLPIHVRLAEVLAKRGGASSERAFCRVIGTSPGAEN